MARARAPGRGLAHDTGTTAPVLHLPPERPMFSVRPTSLGESYSPAAWSRWIVRWGNGISTPLSSNVFLIFSVRSNFTAQ